jgi:hypothetical protein
VLHVVKICRRLEEKKLRFFWPETTFFDKNKNEEINQISASIDRRLFLLKSNHKLPRDLSLGFYEGFTGSILVNETHVRLELQRNNETFMTYCKLLIYL